MRFIAIIVLIILNAPVLALETLSSKHFSVEYEITPKEEFFTGGEKITVNYCLYPKSSAYRVLLGGEENNPRTYHFKTDLKDALWRLVVDYYQGGAWDEDKLGKEVSIDAKYFKLGTEEKGISKITANLTAIVPVCSVRLCNFTAIKATCEDCEEDALSEVKIWVANENVFKNDLKSLRARLSELEQKLKAENLYSEEDFKSVENIIDSAESYLIGKKFLNAEVKLREANESLNQLADLMNKKFAEKLYFDVSSVLSEIQKMLFNSSVLVERLKDHGNYTQFALEQKSLEKEFSNLEDSMKKVESLMIAKKFTNAIEDLKKVNLNASSLKSKLVNFTSMLNSEMEKRKGSWISLSFDVFQIASIVAMASIATVAVIFGLKFRKRRKWDELR